MPAPTNCEPFVNVLSRLVVSDTEQFLTLPIPLLQQIAGAGSLKQAMMGVQLFVLLDRNAVDDQRFALRTLAGTYANGDVLTPKPASPWLQAAGGRWNLLGDKARHLGGATTPLTQAGVLINGATYNTTFTVSERTVGSVNLDLGGTNGTARSTNATFTEAIVSAGVDFAIEPGSTFQGAVDDLTVYPNTAPTDCDVNLYSCPGANNLYRETSPFQTVVMPTATQTVSRRNLTLDWNLVGDGLQVGLVLASAYSAGKLFASIWARRFNWGPGL